MTNPAPVVPSSLTTTQPVAQPQTYADVLRMVLLHMRVTDIESLDADTLVLRFGSVALTLHLAVRPAAVRIDLPNCDTLALSSLTH